MFKDLKRSLGHDIYFREGLPTFQLNLSDTDHCIKLDLAVDSQIISKLFTQGRHRNASVILLLQNAFPKGKHNTSISRNAQCIALFRGPIDRKQIGIMNRGYLTSKNLYSCQFTMMLRLNLILTFWLIMKLIHPFINRLSVMYLVHACHTHCQEF